MLELFDDNFKTSIIKKKILQWATRNMLKANKKKSLGKERKRYRGTKLKNLDLRIQ